MLPYTVGLEAHRAYQALQRPPGLCTWATGPLTLTLTCTSRCTLTAPRGAVTRT